ncbi:DUF1700 domain-containing protein [Chitinibacter sp. FCG-7]|uniref:DUF1700 domain-containing protein n=1 Tax=Chitinibacter mangrovi TaxID=3153927 RepID=A0AAU7F5X6_9NEIS
MNQQEFIAQLERALRLLPAAEVRDIVADYQGYFAEAIANGRSEAEFCAALGSPLTLAEEILAQSAVPALTEESFQGFETDEKSGLSWILHSWRVFKLAPVLFMGLGVIAGGFQLLIGKTTYSAILSPFVGQIIAALIYATAWRFETKRKIDFGADDQQFSRVVLRFLGLATLLAVSGFLHDAISDLIAGRPIAMTLVEVPNAAEAWFGIIWMGTVGTLLWFTSVLIVLQNQSIWRAIQLSVKAVLRYWRQILAIFFWLFLIVIALVVLGWMFIKMAEAITNVKLPAEIWEAEFYRVTLVSWGTAILFLLPYSAWAAIFRDGSMRTEVRQS